MWVNLIKMEECHVMNTSHSPWSNDPLSIIKKNILASTKPVRLIRFYPLSVYLIIIIIIILREFHNLDF